jgi:hypothetical protein
MTILRLLLASAFAAVVAAMSIGAPASSTEKPGATIPWRSWEEAKRIGDVPNARPIYVYLGSELSELSRETEQQTFARAETAAWLAENFLCVRISETADPHIAAFVQDLVERVRHQKGPPYHVWLTPHFEPYEAAGYLPPAEEWSQPGFLKTARAALDAWRERPAAAIAAARELHALAQPEPPSTRLPSVTALLERGTAAWSAAEDRTHGGFGEAPKEHHAEVIRFLLHRGPAAREAALRAADALVSGSLQNPADGGFYRRTIDEAWREPYRQQRLIDQARIAVALLEADEVAHRPDWRQAAHRALRFGLTRLGRPEGGFLAAIDTTEGAVPDGKVGIASLATQGVFLGALIRAGEPFQAEAEALARHLRASIQPVLEGPPGPSAAAPARSAADLLGSAFGLSLCRSPGDQHLARELARTALTQHHDARSGLFWAVSEEGTASLPWRPLALPSPIRAESLALAIGIDPGPREQLRRALRQIIEFDPLPPAEILIALTRDAESAP